jgi:hypothetical protein
MYQLQNNNITGNVCNIIDFDKKCNIPIDPDNTDYQQFKTNINDESAQLETADGVLMTPDEAKAYVATLP